jgi:hypothetical protein
MSAFGVEESDMNRLSSRRSTMTEGVPGVGIHARTCAGLVLALSGLLARESHAAPAPQGAVLVAHFAADPATPRRISNLVDVWNDASPYGNDVFAPAGELFPHFDWFGLNGQPALRFDGTDWLVGGGMPTGSYSVFAMVELDTIAGDQPILGSLFGGVQLGCFGGSGQFEWGQAGATIATTTTVATPGVRTLVRVTFDEITGVGTLSIDGGASVASGTGPLNADSTLQLGAFGLSQRLRGAIAEVAIFDGSLTPFEIAVYEAYFLAKYPATPAPDVRMRRTPRDGELLPRQVATNLAPLDVTGAVYTAGFTNAKLEVLQDNVAFATFNSPLSYVGGAAGFAFATTLPAGLHDYDLKLSIDSGGSPTYVHVVENVVVGDVVLINGQSNASAPDYHTEHGANGDQSPWIRSFGSDTSAPVGGMYPDVTYDFHWDLADGELFPGHASVGAWGLRMGKLLVQSQGVPIAIVNGAEPGTAIAQHFRNPALPADPSTIYGRLLLRTTTAGIASKARAMFWHQGESDYAQPSTYASKLAQLYSQWFLDYTALERVFVVQCRISCSNNTGEISEVHRTACDNLPITSVMSSTALPGYDGCHYFVAGYHALASRLTALVERDLYGAPAVPNVDPPNVSTINWVSPAHTAIVVTYRNPSDTLLLAPAAEQKFWTDDPTVSVQSATVSGNTVTLQLSGASTATVLSYDGANGTGPQPWLTNGSGVGALTFFQQPIL